MISKEEWNEIQTMLTGAFGRVELLIDGFEVVFRIERIRNLKYGIMTYVNGEFRGAWLLEDSEIGKRFYRPVSKFVHTTKTRTDLIRLYGGKRCKKEELERINKKHLFLDPIWNSVKTLRCHLEKNNKEISLVKIGYSV